MASDDDWSVAADSWSIKSDYGSTLDDEQRYADATEVLLTSSSSSSAAAPSASVSANPSSDFRFSDLTGIDYSEGPIELAQNLAFGDGFEHINFLVDDALESKLERRFELVMDEGTLDAIGLHPDGLVKRMMYWQSVASLVSPGGILVPLEAATCMGRGRLGARHINTTHTE